MHAGIVLAGFGNMGRALAAGWVDAGTDPRSIVVLDPSAEARRAAEEKGFHAVASADELADGPAIAVLAVKPAEIESVLSSLPPVHLYLSIAAGRSIADIQALVGGASVVVRAMPNTPAAIRLGITGLCSSANASAADRDAATSLMSAVGAVEWLAQESDMDALTAVSGSGPAYVFLLIECLTAAAVDAGLDRGLAARLATATVRGAGAYAAAADVDAATLRRQVTSPKGTTEAALRVLLEGDALPGLVRSAVLAAAERSRELRRK